MAGAFWCHTHLNVVLQALLSACWRDALGPDRFIVVVRSSPFVVVVRGVPADRKKILSANYRFNFVVVVVVVAHRL